MITERPASKVPESVPAPTDAPETPRPDLLRKSDVPRQSDIPRQTMPAITPGVAITERAGVARLTTGHSVSVVQSGSEEVVEVRSVTGQLMVSIRFGENGPVFAVSGASLEISATKDLSIHAETIHMKARGDATIEAGAMLRTAGRDVEVQAHPGQVAITANDDVDITGERVRLNSDDPPMPQSWEEHRARHAINGDPFSTSAPLTPNNPSSRLPGGD